MQDLKKEILKAERQEGKKLLSHRRKFNRLLMGGMFDDKTILEGHTAHVNCVAFSPDSSLVASGSIDSTVKIWNAFTGECIKTLEGHPFQVWSVAFSQDGKTLASGGAPDLDEDSEYYPEESAKLNLWDVETGELKNTLYIDNPINVVSFSPNGSMLAAGTYKEVVIWSLKANGDVDEFMKTLSHSGVVDDISFSPDSSMFATTKSDYRTGNHHVKIWNIARGECIHTLQVHDSVSSVSFSPDGSKVASGSGHTTVKVWDSTTGREITSLSIEGDAFSSCHVAFSPDGQFLATGAKYIELWDVDTGFLSSTRLRASYRDVGSSKNITWSPDGKKIAGTYGRQVHIHHDMAKERKKRQLELMLALKNAKTNKHDRHGNLKDDDLSQSFTTSAVCVKRLESIFPTSLTKKSEFFCAVKNKKKTNMDCLKSKILALEERQGQKDVSLRRHYNRLLLGGAKRKREEDPLRKLTCPLCGQKYFGNDFSPHEFRIEGEISEKIM